MPAPSHIYRIDITAYENSTRTDVIRLPVTRSDRSALYSYGGESVLRRQLGKPLPVKEGPDGNKVWSGYIEEVADIQPMLEKVLAKLKHDCEGYIANLAAIIESAKKDVQNFPKRAKPLSGEK